MTYFIGSLATVGAVFNIEVLNICQLPFWLLEIETGVFLGPHFTKICYAKFPLVTMKASPKIACHNIQWL